MVNSIHQAARIGVIHPPGQLRKVGQRRHSRKDSREEGNTTSQTAEEETTTDNSGGDQDSVTTCRTVTVSSDESDHKQTGRRIDLKI